MKYFIGFVLMVILAITITGFFFAGTPAAERERQFDERRVSDLQYITDAVTTHWRVNKSVPANPGEIKDFSLPHDPVTQAPYEYTKTGDKTYSLCATFTGSNISQDAPAYPKTPYPYYGGNIWNHEAGRVCFDQEVHPELFEPTLAP